MEVNPSFHWRRGRSMRKGQVHCLSLLPLFAVALLFMFSDFAAAFTARGDAGMPYLGLCYENTTLTRNLYGTVLLKLYCGGKNQFPCNDLDANIATPAELASGNLPQGMHVTEKGDIEGMPTEAGDWYGTVRLPGYNVTSGGQRYDYGDLMVEFHLHVNYYCNTPNC